MTKAQLEMAAQAIAEIHDCDLSDGCPSLRVGNPCMCVRFAAAALEAAENCAEAETAETKQQLAL